jgi:hypothetical protein
VGEGEKVGGDEYRFEAFGDHIGRAPQS